MQAESEKDTGEDKIVTVLRPQAAGQIIERGSKEQRIQRKAQSDA